ncbi:MAG: ATP-binding protein, partial [Planctomycetota bacterium]|nr:ATP-binding protein [Planctomycetota bacterium]
KRIFNDHGGKELLTVVVTTRILGADLNQFCIDIDADQMILLTEAEHEIVDRVTFGLKQQGQPHQSPVYYVHSNRQDLVRDLEHLMHPQQQLVPFEERLYARIWNEDGGMLLVDEVLLEELNHRTPVQVGGEYRLDNVATKLGMGIVVILDEESTQNSKDPEARAMHWLSMGAIDCLEFDTPPAEIARRCNCARRNRARIRLENDLDAEISRIENAMSDKDADIRQYRGWSAEDGFFQSPSTAFLIHDLAGNIKRANSKAVGMFGYDMEALGRMRMGELHPDGVEMTAERKMHFDAFCETGIAKFETRFLKKNRSTFMGVVNARFIKVKELAGNRDLILTEIHSLDQQDLISKTLSTLFSAKSKELDSRINDALGEVIGEIRGGERQDTRDFLAGISVYTQSEDGFESAFQDGYRESGLQINPAPRIRDIAGIVQWFKSGNSILDPTPGDGSGIAYALQNEMSGAAYSQLESLFLDSTGFEYFAIPMWVGQDFIGFSVVALKNQYSLSVNNYHRKKTSRILRPIVNIVAGVIHRRDEEVKLRILEERSTQQDKHDALNNITEGICHDYNNLLTAISGHASLLLSGVGLEEEMRKSLEGIRGAANRGAGLSKKIRDRARPSQVTAIFSLHEKIKEVVQLLAVTIDPKISIQLELDASSDTIVGDSGQAHQVIMNLIINASQAMTEAGQFGTITIRSRVKKSSSQFNSDVIELRFEDEGPGIDSEHLMKIFEPYFTTKDLTAEGAGLGLWVVQNVMKQHGGTIKVGKKKDRGATFITEWPLEVDLDKPHEPRSIPLLKGSGLVLLVDDDAEVRETCRMLLNAIGYQVITACDGLQALEVYENESEAIDLVLLDQKMPRMAGNECLEKLIQLDPEIRVVMTSGNSLRHHRIQQSDNVVGVLPKPYTIEVLSSVLEAAILDRAP